LAAVPAARSVIRSHDPEVAVPTTIVGPQDRLGVTDDVLLRSYNWARWQLGIPLPVE
jgi:hypothetical protein